MPVQETLDQAQKQALITVSNELMNKAQWPRLAIAEQRLVLYMLALVEKGDSDFKTYRISIRELANIIGSKNKNLYREFDRATDGLMTKIIRWMESPYSKQKRLKKVTWCSFAEVAEGEGFVQLSFDPHLKPFLLALKGNFTQYELRAVIRLQGHYSLRIYQFLKFNQGMARRDGRQSALVSLDWLKQYLDIPPEQYRLYGHFKSKVLKPAQRDIAAKTDLLFEFEQHKEGRKVAFIEFLWRRNPAYDQTEMTFLREVDREPKEPPDTAAPSPGELSEPPPAPADAIAERLAELGFDDWARIRPRLSDGNWRTAFADLDFNLEERAARGDALKNPGGWLRRRVKQTGPDQPYQPTKAYQRHRDEEEKKRQRAERRAAIESRRKRHEAQQRERERRLEERIAARLDALSGPERDALREEARRKAREILPAYAADPGEEIEAARAWLDRRPLPQVDEIRRKARAELQVHLKQTGSTLDLDAPAGARVLENRMLQIVARDNDLALPSRARYDERIERTAEPLLHDLVRETYGLTGDPD